MSTIPRPRLLFDQTDIPDLRKRADTVLDGRVRDHLLRSCEALLDPSHEHYLDYKEKHKEDWYFRHGMFRIFPALHALAAGYVIAGDERYGIAARDAVMTIIDEGLADHASKAWGNDYKGWRHGPGHDKGKLAWVFAWVFDFCYDLFDAAQRKRFAQFADESITIFQSDPNAWRFDQAQVTNNRGVRGLLSLAFWAMACEGEDGFTHDIDMCLNTGWVAIDKHLHMVMDADGAPYEGIGYAGSIGTIGQAACALGRRGKVNALASHRFARICEYMLYELVPGGWSCNNLNDCDLPAGSVSVALPLMREGRAPLLPWLAQQLDLHPKRTPQWIDGDEANPDDLAWIMWWDDEQPLRTPAELDYPISHRFLTRGIASLRSGWQPDDWLVSHFCGREEIICHRQGDKNHITFWAGDEMILADPGYGGLAKGYKRDYTQEVDRYYQKSDVHNVVLFNGQNQHSVHSAFGWSEGAMLDFEHEENRFTASLGDAAAATGPNHTVRRSLRRVVHVSKHCIVVVDLNELDGKPFNLDVQWQTHPNHRIELTDGGFVIHGLKNRCRAWTFSPQELAASLHETYTFPQVRLRTHAAVSEVVTVFALHDAAVKIEREAEGVYNVTVDDVTINAAAAVTMPLRKPIATRVAR